MVHVPLDCKRIDWLPHETWTKETLPKLEAVGIKANDLRRCVYVIRLNGDYCIEYPGGTSPTLYVGQGNFKHRITRHRTWITGLKDLVGDFEFQLCITLPRVQKCENAYLDAEAAILDRFAERYRSAPLWNKRFQNRLYDHTYSDFRSTKPYASEAAPGTNELSHL